MPVISLLWSAGIFIPFALLLWLMGARGPYSIWGILIALAASYWATLEVVGTPRKAPEPPLESPLEREAREADNKAAEDAAKKQAAWVHPIFITAIVLTLVIISQGLAAILPILVVGGLVGFLAFPFILPDRDKMFEHPFFLMAWIITAGLLFLGFLSFHSFLAPGLEAIYKGLIR